MVSTVLVMLRHVVMFRWTPDTTDEAVAAATATLRALPAQIGAIRSYHVGSDAGLAPGNWDYVVVADLDDVDGYAEYRDHPAHQAAIVSVLRPMIAERAAVQYFVQ